MLGCVTDLRSTLHVHGAHLRHEPAHGLQGWVVVEELSAAAQEVLLLKDHHAAAVVRLGCGVGVKRRVSGKVSINPV